MLKDMIKRPGDASRNLKRFSAALVFHLTYGRRLRDDDLNAMQSIINSVIQDLTPGAHLVDSLPFLDMLPDFLTPWRAEARGKHDHDYEVRRGNISTLSRTGEYFATGDYLCLNMHL